MSIWCWRAASRAARSSVIVGGWSRWEPTSRRTSFCGAGVGICSGVRQSWVGEVGKATAASSPLFDTENDGFEVGGVRRPLSALVDGDIKEALATLEGEDEVDALTSWLAVRSIVVEFVAGDD